MAFCSVCGNEILDGQKFCSRCGTPVAVPFAAEAAEELNTAVTETVAAVEEPVAETVEAVTEAVEEAPAATEAVVEEAAAAVEEPVVEAVEEAAEPVVEAVEEPAAPVVEPVVAPVEPAPAPAVEPAPAPETPDPLTTAAAVVFTPGTTEPTPVYQQPVQPEPVYQQPVYQQPVQQEPVYQQPVQQPYQPVDPYQQPVPQPVLQQTMEQAVYQPVYAQAVYQQQIVQPEKKKRKKLGWGSRILAFFLCIFLLIFGAVSMVVFCVRKSLSTNNLTDVLKESSNITSLEVGQLVGEKDSEDETLAHYVLSQIPEDQKELYPELTEENLSKLLENEDVTNIISSTLGDVVGYYTGEKDTLAIDTDKIMDTLTENADLIEQYTGKKMQTEDFDAIRTQIDDFNENELAEISNGEAADGIAKAVKYIRFAFSNTAFYILLGITGFFALMILLTCGRFIDSSLLHIGVTTALVGGAGFFGTRYGVDKLEDALDGKVGKNTFDMLKKLVFDHFENVGLIVLCVGAGLVLFGIIIKIVRVAMRRNA